MSDIPPAGASPIEPPPPDRRRFIRDPFEAGMIRSETDAVQWMIGQLEYRASCLRREVSEVESAIATIRETAWPLEVPA
jgi:hypothetical protein